MRARSGIWLGASGLLLKPSLPALDLFFQQPERDFDVVEQPPAAIKMDTKENVVLTIHDLESFAKQCGDISVRDGESLAKGLVRYCDLPTSVGVDVIAPSD